MISIIIPTYNEADTIVATLNTIRERSTGEWVKEIIVADGNSPDNTVLLASAAGATVVVSTNKGRAAQMNYGALQATQPILYFLHADTVPPAHFDAAIIKAMQQGFTSGCFMLAFDHEHWFLKANCWFTRFRSGLIRFGDQSLFVKKDVFITAKGFKESLIVMEDQEIIGRLRKLGKFAVIKKPVTTSARKYLANGIYKTQGIFFLIYFMYYLGYPQEKLVQTYRRLIKQDKV